MADHLETLAKRRAAKPEPAGDHPFDRFARRYASGLSRRHALKMALAGGLWLSAARQGIVAPPAHGRTLGRRRLRRCVACDISSSTGAVYCGGCNKLAPGLPTPAKLGDVAKNDKAARRLRAHARRKRYRPGRQRLYHISRDGRPDLVAVEQPFTTPAGRRAAVFTFARVRPRLRANSPWRRGRPLSFMLVGTGRITDPTHVVTAPAGRRSVRTSNPWPRRPSVASSRLGESGAQAAGGQDCRDTCNKVCEGIEEGCQAGIPVAIAACARATQNPYAVAGCAAAAAIVCALTDITDECRRYMCGPICGCGPGEELCAPGTEFARCTPLNASPNCGDCGVTCKGRQECVLDDTSPGLYRCACRTAGCPRDAPPDPDTCECKCPEGLQICDDECVDIRTDARNCGGCGNRCREDHRCNNGICDCPIPLQRCARGERDYYCCAQGDACCQLRTDPPSYFHQCYQPGSICCAGGVCPADFTCCADPWASGLDICCGPESFCVNGQCVR